MEEIEWFSKADLSEYAGKYIAIIDNQVAAFGEDAKEVWNKAREDFPDKIPSLTKIPKEELLILKENHEGDHLPL